MAWGWFRGPSAGASDVAVGSEAIRSKEQAELEQMEEEVRRHEHQSRMAALRARLARPDSGSDSSEAAPAAVSTEATSGTSQALAELKQQHAEAQEEMRRQRDEMQRERELLRKEQEQARLQQEQQRREELERRQQEELDRKNAEARQKQLEEQRQRREQIAAMEATIARLQASLEAPSVSVPAHVAAPSEEQRALERQIAQADADIRRGEQNLLQSRPIGAIYGDSARDPKLDSIRRRTESLRQSASDRHRSVTAAEAEQRNLSATLPSERDITAESRRTQQLMDQATKGMDICILMDCTGSMAWAIASCKRQISAILDKVQTQYPDAIIRVAFVGYKDHGDGNERIMLHKFVGKENISSIQDFVAKIRASGGGDGPEDIAGALQTALDLLADREQGFRAQTRMIIHLADAPCHGSKYHSMRDDYPSGDPSGLDPEELLRKLAQKNVDYYFMEVRSADTKKMTTIFQNSYPKSDNAMCGFHVLPMQASPDDFMPQVLASITMSASRPTSYFSSIRSAEPGGTPYAYGCDEDDAATTEY